MRAKVKDKDYLERDMNNNALLFINKEELKEYKNKKQSLKKIQNLDKNYTILKKEMFELKNEVKSILHLLKENFKNEKSENDWYL